MNSLAEYFHTDWAAMTVSDWVGTILTVVIFVLMVLVYFQVFRPKNRDRLEARKYIPFEDDNEFNGDKDGGK
ncbi:cbb3-type cytochrome c oxidase subunit 3 [uncultured Thiodictyon sp.]|uniref:cbb3-type cytochrome c oxidase subunit 3 n=1 Tax=uncultured Thiodictyon sp. TaxID=1846217 RepID=UPI0025D1B93C|nr:cbb3-type cytochrome c oxidase subunit 3 [uncultured Thiodictyon sp.]